MRITLRWERNRDHQLIAFLGCGGIRAVRLGGLRHHAEKFDHGTGEVWSPVLRDVRRWSFPGGMGNGADSTVVGGSAPVLSSRFSLLSCWTKFQQIAELVLYQVLRFSDAVIPFTIRCPWGLRVILRAVHPAGLRRGRAEDGRLRRG